MSARQTPKKEVLGVLWCRIIPITQVTEKDWKQKDKASLLCHSRDRFIIQPEANFDKQFGTISPNLLVILCNIQRSTIREKKVLR